MVAYGVERRRRELGVRVALGAGGWQLIGMVMRQAGALLAVGLAAGAALGGLAAHGVDFRAVRRSGATPLDPGRRRRRFWRQAAWSPATCPRERRRASTLSKPCGKTRGNLPAKMPDVTYGAVAHPNGLWKL